MDFQIESGKLYLYGKIVREDLAELIPIFSEYVKNQEENITFDLEAVDSIDTLVLQTLIAVKRSAKQTKKSFKLTNISQEVSDIFKISGMDAVFEKSIDKNES